MEDKDKVTISEEDITEGGGMFQAVSQKTVVTIPIEGKPFTREDLHMAEEAIKSILKNSQPRDLIKRWFTRFQKLIDELSPLEDKELRRKFGINADITELREQIESLDRNKAILENTINTNHKDLHFVALQGMHCMSDYIQIIGRCAFEKNYFSGRSYQEHGKQSREYKKEDINERNSLLKKQARDLHSKNNNLTSRNIAKLIEKDVNFWQKNGLKPIKFETIRKIIS